MSGFGQDGTQAALFGKETIVNHPSHSMSKDFVGIYENDEAYFSSLVELRRIRKLAALVAAALQ